MAPASVRMKHRDILQCRKKHIRARLIQSRMLEIDNLVRYLVISVGKALKIYSLLFTYSVATINRAKGGQPTAAYPNF
jgi:hypothetical protein